MRKWIGLAAFLGALAWQLGFAAAETQLKVMVFPGIQNLPFFVAEEKGFFAKRGLAVEVLLAPNSGELRDGLARNSHQIAHAGSDNAVAMAELGKADIAIVMGGDNGWNRLFVQPEIASLAELRGKTVIVDAPNTAYALLLYKMLAMAGLKKGDYEVKAIGATATRLQEMQKEKAYAASMLNPPFSLQAARAGLKDMGAVLDTVGPYQATAGFVMRGWAKENADALVRYIQAQLESLRWIYDPANKAEATALLAAKLKLPPEVATQTFALATDPATGFAKDAAIDIAGFSNVLKLRAEIEGQWGGTPPSPEKYLDPSYRERALAGL
jgi:ABC-type nitrate/sulfonate/bicarbonate transport system substrate-binding protein